MSEKKVSINELRRLELVLLKKKLKLGEGSLLRAEQVVEVAQDVKKYPALHSWFEWDNEKAGHEHRLRQARMLLVEVTILTPDNESVQAFVSLKSDRKNPGGGYRETVSVLGNIQMREELLQQAWDEFEYWRGKYRTFKELFPVFEAADKAKPRLDLKKKFKSHREKVSA